MMKHFLYGELRLYSDFLVLVDYLWYCFVKRGKIIYKIGKMFCESPISISGEKEHNPVVISETDLTSLLEQLPMSDFYSLAYLHFSTTSKFIFYLLYWWFIVSQEPQS